MPAVPDLRQPVWTDPLDEGLDWIRANYHFLLLQVSLGAPLRLGWTTTIDVSENGNNAEPDAWILTRGIQTITINLEWTSGQVSQAQICYADGVSSPDNYCFPATTLNEVENDPFSVTAKHFGDGSSPENYYLLDRDSVSPRDYGGFIDSTGSGDTWEQMTLVFCINVQSHANAYFIAGTSYQLFIYCETDGSMVIRSEDFLNLSQVVDIDASASPQANPWPENTWRVFILGINNDSSSSPETRYWELWGGTVGTPGSWEQLFAGVPIGTSIRGSMHPQNNAGNLWVGHDGWDLDPALNCYASFLWCDESFIDPSVEANRLKFVDSNLKPIDLGADGSGPTGSQPDSYFPDFDLTNNRGFGRDWQEIGTVPAAPSSPTD